MQPLAYIQERGRKLTTWLLRPATIRQRNIRNVLIDGIGVGLVTGVGTFLSVFLVRLGASPFLVGLLTAMPALTGVLLAIPVGRFLERQRNIVPWYSRSRVLVFASYALIGLVPFFFSVQAAPIAIITIWALVTVPQTIVNVAFTVVMGAVAGPHQRYYLMSRRWSLLGATTAISVALVGVVLDQIRFPLNYQAVFIGSFAGGLLAFAFSSQIVIPDNESAEAAQRPHRPWHARLREVAAAFQENAAYSRFVLSAFVFNAGLMLAAPVFPLYWVRALHASDSWIGIINTVNNGVLLGAYFLWTALLGRKGVVFVLRVCGFGLALYPLLTGLTKSVPPLALYAGMAGVFGAGINLVLFDILLSTCPQQRTASYVALYQTTTYAATFLGPLLGTTLAASLGYAPALFVSSGLRLAGVVLFILLDVGATATPEHKPAELPTPVRREVKG